MTLPIVWRTEKRRIGDLVEWERNPRQLSEKQARDLEASLAKFGYVEEIVLNADGKSIIGGHQRRRVIMAQALLRPDDEVDCRIPDRPLSEEEGIELALRLNLNTGAWDFDLLANDYELSFLKEIGFEEFQLGMFNAEETTPGPAPQPKSEFRQMTFVVHESQAEVVERALEHAKKLGLHESSINENSNGNSLAEVCGQWLAQKTSE